MTQKLQDIEWQISDGLVDYPAALAVMEARVAAIAAGTARELVWLLQHPPLYTSGTNSRPAELLDARFPVYPVGRGGKYTYHGPGQRVAYVMLDLNKRHHGAPDLHRYVTQLEDWVMQSLSMLDVTAERRDDSDDRRVGLWVKVPRADAFAQESGGRLCKAQSVPASYKDHKIAAIGVRVRKWVSFHGVAINVNPDLSHFSGIVPCGIVDHGVTSLAALGKNADMNALDTALQTTWNKVF